MNILSFNLIQRPPACHIMNITQISAVDHINVAIDIHMVSGIFFKSCECSSVRIHASMLLLSAHSPAYNYNGVYMFRPKYSCYRSQTVDKFSPSNRIAFETANERKQVWPHSVIATEDVGTLHRFLSVDDIRSQRGACKVSRITRRHSI